MSDVDSLLHEIGLAKYAKTLADHEIDLKALRLLSENDLEKIGIPLGDRKKLLAAVEALDRHDRERAANEVPTSSLTERRGLSENPAPMSGGPTTPQSSTGDGPGQAPPAERRQVTIMFCDLIGSTKLSQELDPEDLGEVLSTYQSTCRSIIERFNGTISRILGDGLLVLFGYPVAHEDAAERAVRAGLGLIEAISKLDMSGLKTSAPLQLRIGIATGMVVAGDLIRAGATEYSEQQSIVGSTPNLAARLQTIAVPNTVVASETTWQLIQGLFECEDLGAHHLEGFAEPMRAVRVVRERRIESRFEATRGIGGLTPAVGRQRELALLRDRWQAACAGNGQIVAVVGEAGIGKSRLIRLLRDEISVGSQNHLSYYCSAHHRNTMLFPLINEIERSAEISPDDNTASKMRKLTSVLARTGQDEDATLQLVAALLSIVDPADPAPQSRAPVMTPELRKSRTLQILASRFKELCRHRPLLLIFEDLHWSDPTTLELLKWLFGMVKDLSILVALTTRPGLTPPWDADALTMTIGLDRLDRRDSAALIDALTDGKALPDLVREQILKQTDGIPLFIEELTKSVLEAGLLTLEGGTYRLEGALPAFAIPSSLQDSLMARLDRLPQAKMVAQVGAVMGRQFSYDLLTAVTYLTAAEITSAIEELVKAELIHWRSAVRQGTYSFKHALVQDVAYNSLLRRGRRELHGRIARTLEAHGVDGANIQPEIVAHHYSEAGMLPSAIKFWLMAGRQAAQRSAHKEATDHLSRGLALLEAEPRSEARDRLELEFQTTLGPSLIAVEGYVAAKVERAYARARELCGRVGGSEQLVHVLRGLWAYYMVCAQLETAREVSEQLIALAEAEASDAYALEGHRTHGQAQFYLGNFSRALPHLERTLELYESGKGHDHAVRYGNEPKAVALCYVGWLSWFLGYPKRALETSLRAVDHARTVGHPFSIAQVSMGTAYVHALCRNAPAAQSQAERVLAYAREQGFPYWAVIAEIFVSWGRAQQEDSAEALELMRRRLGQLKSIGAIVAYPWFCSLLAEAHCGRGEFEAAGEILSDGLAVAQATHDGFSLPELHRIQGDLLHSGGDLEASQRCLERALSEARAQEARSWETRTGVSLARCWDRAGRRTEARALLTTVIDGFPEPDGSADLADAVRLRAAFD